MTIIAVNLVALGVVVLAFSGIFFSPPGPLVNSPGMHLTATERHVVPLVVGVLAVGGGSALLMVKPKRAA